MPGARERTRQSRLGGFGASVRFRGRSGRVLVAGAPTSACYQSGRRRSSTCSSLGLALALLAATAVAGENGHLFWLPDPKLTPGAFAESSTAAICVRGYDRAHRVWHDKASTLARYRIAPSDAALYEDDDLIPVCLGVDNAAPLNHWPQPLEWDAGKKDMLERQLCTEICLTRDDTQLARYRPPSPGTGRRRGARPSDEGRAWLRNAAARRAAPQTDPRAGDGRAAIEADDAGRRCCGQGLPHRLVQGLPPSGPLAQGTAHRRQGRV